MGFYGFMVYAFAVECDAAGGGFFGFVQLYIP